MKPIDKLAAIAASVTLAVTFLAVGLTVCAGPNLPTRLLAEAFSGSDNPETPFTNDELVDMAVATKEYCFNSHSEEELYAAMARINQSAAAEYRGMGPESPVVGALEAAMQTDGTYDATAADDAMQIDGTYDTDALKEAFSQVDEAYAYTPEAISHLDDVADVVQAVRVPLALVGIFAIAAAAHVGVRAGKRPLGGVLIAAGTLLLTALAVVGAWALVDFNGFFAVFHSLFFAAGTWTFSWDSLLITALPLPFWMGMAGLWLGTAALLCAASIAIGAKLRRSAI